MVFWKRDEGSGFSAVYYIAALLRSILVLVDFSVLRIDETCIISALNGKRYPKG